MPIPPPPSTTFQLHHNRLFWAESPFHSTHAAEKNSCPPRGSLTTSNTPEPSSPSLLPWGRIRNIPSHGSDAVLDAHLRVAPREYLGDQHGLVGTDVSVSERELVDASSPPVCSPELATPLDMTLDNIPLRRIAARGVQFGLGSADQHSNANKKCAAPKVIALQASNRLEDDEGYFEPCTPGALTDDDCDTYMFSPFDDDGFSEYNDPSPDEPMPPPNIITSHLMQVAGTPFDEYVDRAVVHPHTMQGNPSVSFVNAPAPQQAEQFQPAEANANAVEMQAYRTLAEPLSIWLAEYVWKVCATGFGLPDEYAPQAIHYNPRPSSVLAHSIHSLLCYTHLQPSGIVLALWYITRLPVAFNWDVDPLQHAREFEFRAELFTGDAFSAHMSGEEPNVMEARIVFRVVLLGCMLANKWLDDHTFSNKTWQALSELPIQSINALEVRALSVLGHDLSIAPKTWDSWLASLRSYHMSLTPYPTPIMRPSTQNSNTLIRKFLEDLMATPALSKNLGRSQEPVFIGLADRIKSKNAQSRDYEIDLDQDGPLREEYLPRRRHDGGDDMGRENIFIEHSGVQPPKRRWDGEFVGQLPPPARWIPEADPPIERPRDKSKTRYVAPSVPLQVRKQNAGAPGGMAFIMDPPSMQDMAIPMAAPPGPPPPGLFGHSLTFPSMQFHPLQRHRTIPQGVSSARASERARHNSITSIPHEQPPFVAHARSISQVPTDWHHNEMVPVESGYHPFPWHAPAHLSYPAVTNVFDNAGHFRPTWLQT